MWGFAEVKGRKGVLEGLRKGLIGEWEGFQMVIGVHEGGVGRGVGVV